MFKMFKLNQTCTVTFFMKSGNKLVVDKVTRGFTVGYIGNDVTKLADWKQSPRAKNFLFLAALNLSQIEAITTS